MTIIRYLIVIITFILLLSIFNNITTNVEETSEGAKCRTSISARSLTKDKLLIPTVSAACEPIDKRISLDGMTKRDLMREVSDYMANAWWMTNQGRTSELWDDSSILGDDVECVTLYYITLDDVDKRDFEDDTVTSEELKEFMEYEQHNDQYTYHQYIQVSGGNGVYEIQDDIEMGPEFYTISMVSPDYGILRTGNRDPANTLLFSDLEKSVEYGCYMMSGDGMESVSDKDSEEEEESSWWKFW